MSNSNEILKKCCRCENILLKSNFYKNKGKRDGVSSICKVCMKDYIREYTKNKIKTDVNFRLICNTRRRFHHVLNGKSKSSSTRDILGIDIDLYRKWIEYQMTPEINWQNIEIDHVKAISIFDVSKDEELREAFNWKNTQPLLKEVHQQKGTKFKFLDYQPQFIKAYQFIKLNEERFNKNIH